jgi:hypothetical protein
VSRVRLACDACAFDAWLGESEDAWDAWCEACQRPARLERSAVDDFAPCPSCGGRLTLEEPRFEELWGELQNLVAVLEAALGDPTRLTPLVPERPRTLAEAPDTTDWNRAAAILIEQVAARGFPSPKALGEARALAGPPSSFWSDHTAGRLLFTLVVERAAARREESPRDLVRRAEAEVEFGTFTDSAMLILGYERLGLREEVERLALPLATDTAAAIRRQPFLKGAAGREVDRALEAALAHLGAGRVEAAHRTALPLLGRSDLARYRIPCGLCGRGTIGVERLEESGVES